jgi:large subunit ribosomal protein L35
MPKMKTHRAAAKRFRVTKNGKILRGKAFGAHILTKKTRKRKRQLRKQTTVAAADAKRIIRLIPYM